MKHFAAAIIGALAFYAISPSSLAGSVPDGAPQEIVKFGDLDLTRPAGAQELYRRIRQAARHVCDSHVACRYVVSIGKRNCMDQAIERAVAAVDAPLLAAAHEELTGRQILQPQQARLNR